MSTGQTLRTMVTARLTAVAEDIIALFEGTVAEYEEELCVCKQEILRNREENKKSQQENLKLNRMNQRNREEIIALKEEIQRNQALLQSKINPKIALPRPGSQDPPSSPGSEAKQGPKQGLNPGLAQESDQNSDQEDNPHPLIKEEPEEIDDPDEPNTIQLPEVVPKRVKTEESSLPQQSELREDLSTDKHDFDDWSAPFSCSEAQMETEADGDHYHRVMAAQDSGPDSFVGDGDLFVGDGDSYAGDGAEAGAPVYNEDMSGTAEGEKKHQCPLCLKQFTRKQTLQIHFRVHTGEKPYSCSICEKTFAKKFTLDGHMRTHTGERPYSCFYCTRSFTQSSSLKTHMKKTHNRKWNV
ncbi:unnamed protein product [Knipowitschia caucasica]